MSAFSKNEALFTAAKANLKTTLQAALNLRCDSRKTLITKILYNGNSAAVMQSLDLG